MIVKTLHPGVGEHATAIHEAGHAVAAFIVGANIHECYVRRETYSRGVTSVHWPTDIDQTYRLLFIVSGPMAQAKFQRDDSSKREIAGEDSRLLRQCYSRLSGNQIRAGERLATRFVEACWPAICVVALELANDRRLNERQISDIIVRDGDAYESYTVATDLLNRSEAAPCN